MTMDGSTWILVLFAADGACHRAPGTGPLLATLRGLPRWALAELPPGADGTAIAAASRDSAQAHCLDGFGRRLHVGSTPAEVATARELGLAFVGRGSGAAATRLRQAGARVVLEDFADLEATLTAFATAPVPS